MSSVFEFSVAENYISRDNNGVITVSPSGGACSGQPASNSIGSRTFLSLSRNGGVLFEFSSDFKVYVSGDNVITASDYDQLEDGAKGGYTCYRAYWGVEKNADDSYSFREYSSLSVASVYRSPYSDTQWGNSGDTYVLSQTGGGEGSVHYDADFACGTAHYEYSAIPEENHAYEYSNGIQIQFVPDDADPSFSVFRNDGITVFFGWFYIELLPDGRIVGYYYKPRNFGKITEDHSSYYTKYYVDGKLAPDYLAENCVRYDIENRWYNTINGSYSLNRSAYDLDPNQECPECFYPSCVAFLNFSMKLRALDVHEIEVSLSDVTKTYDGSGWSFPNNQCPATKNFTAGDGVSVPVSITYSPSSTSKNVNLAGYPITAHFEVNSSSYSNYHLDTDTKIFKAYITPRPLTFAYTKPVFDDKEYDGNPFPEYVVPTVTYDGLVSGDCVNVTGSASKDPSEWTKQVGTYSVNVSFNVDACTGTDLSNYSYTAPESYSDSAEITQKKLLVPCCPCPDEKYYDCHPFSISFPSVLTGKVGRDDAYLTYSPDNLDEYVDAGNYPVTFTFGIGGADAGNYKFVDEFGNDCNTRSTTYRIKPMYICYDMDTEPAILCDSVGEDGIPYKVYDGYPLVVRSPIIFVSGVSECDMNDDPHTAKIRIRSTFFPSVDTTFRKDARLYSTRVYYNHEVDDGVDEDNYNFVDAPYVAIVGYSDQGCGCGGHIYDETTRVCNGGLPESVELVGRIICKEITPVATVSMDGLEPVVEDVEFDMIAGDNLIVRTSCEVVEFLDGYVVVRVHYLLDGIDRDNYCLSSAEEDVEVEFTPNEADFFEIVFVDEDGELDADVVCDGGACSVVYDAKIHYVTVRLKELEEGEIGSWLQDWVDGLSVDPESLKWIIEHNGETVVTTGEERVGKMHAGIYNLSAYMMFDDGYELIGEVTFTINPRPLYLENLSVRYE